MITATSETAISDADRYLKEVAPHLSALRADERAELLDDLAQHLQEIAAEPGPPLRERLGPPEAYAAELLATAGVTPLGRPRRGVVVAATAAGSRLRASIAGREAVRVWPVVRQAWWVARGYLAVSFLAALGDGHAGFPAPDLLGNPLLGLVAVAIAIPLSVRLGQRPLAGAGRLAVIAANAALLVFAVALADQAGSTDRRDIGPGGSVQVLRPDGCLRDGGGERITNLYAYDAEGKLLDPVLLYDQNGRPVDNLCPQYDAQGRRLFTDYRRDVNGASVINAFPRRQATSVLVEPPYARPFEPAQPDATVPVNPPAVVVPRLAPTTTVP